MASGGDSCRGESYRCGGRGHQGHWEEESSGRGSIKHKDLKAGSPWQDQGWGVGRVVASSRGGGRSEVWERKVARIKMTR